ncbi:glucose-1-phosphate adenylyltransferase [Candidatus Parcubacteria bacterium]|nr:glucose-1-phosphate adenylyltransferase [Candidatus Parcubacteria bacterium]
MIGAILCGRYGKRLKPLTDNVPKPLLEIKDGYTILDKQIMQFKYAGIDKVVLLCGYLHEKIQERFGDNWNGVEINYLIEDEPRGTLYAINNLMKNFDSENYIIRNGDVVCDANIKEMIREHKNKMLMYISPLISPYGIVELSEERIVGFKEKPKINHYLNAGIYIISKDLKPLISKYPEGAIEEISFPEISQEGLMNHYEEDGFWQSVDSIKDLNKVRQEYKDREDKPWGFEKIIVCTDKYMAKKLYIMKGEGTAFHKHLKKDETMVVAQGKVVVKFPNKEVILSAGEKIQINPGTEYSIVALENATIQEYSTPYPEDTIRIEDKYGRK